MYLCAHSHNATDLYLCSGVLSSILHGTRGTGRADLILVRVRSSISQPRRSSLVLVNRCQVLQDAYFCPWRRQARDDLVQIKSEPLRIPRRRRVVHRGAGRPKRLDRKRRSLLSKSYAIGELHTMTNLHTTAPRRIEAPAQEPQK